VISPTKVYDGFSEYKASAVVLIGANCLPLFGVLFLGWDAFAIVALYWSENVVIGAINVLKMITCSPEPERLILGEVDANDRLNRARMERSRGDSVTMLRLVNNASKLFYVPFFVVHYGGFCLGHGVFIVELFDRESAAGLGSFNPLATLAQLFSAAGMWWCVLALAASHLSSFFINYLGRGEYRRTSVPILMFQPYARVIVLHIAIILGGLLSKALGSNIGILAILVVGKTFLDLSLHLVERTKNDPRQTDSPVLPDVITAAVEQSPATRTASER
jgi:hypothetical protein